MSSCMRPFYSRSPVEYLEVVVLKTKQSPTYRSLDSPSGPSRLHYKSKEGNVLFNNALDTFYLWLYAVVYMVKHNSERAETCCHHNMGYSFQLEARDLLYAPPHRQYGTPHSLCYTSCGALAEIRHSSVQPRAPLSYKPSSLGIEKEMF